jgi:lipopolysaccharide export system permease protein
MRILNRYILTQTFALSLIMTMIFAAAVWLTQSLRFIDLLIARGLSLWSFLKLSSFLLPSLISAILPIGFLIALFFLFAKLYQDGELIVLRALGLSNWQIIRPIMGLALLFVGLLYTMHFYIQPLANKSFKDLRETIRNNLTGEWIQPGTFTILQGVTFYTKEKTHRGEMRGIFAYDARDKKHPTTIMAEVGQILETTNGLRFVLFRGSRQSIDAKNGKPTILHFDQYSVEIESQKFLAPRHRKANELLIDELFNSDADLPEKEAKQRLIEIHERLLLPLSVFPFALLAGLTFLYGDYNRRGRTKRMILGGGLCFLLEIMLVSFLNIASKPIFLGGAYGLMALTLLVTAILLFRTVCNPVRPKL